MPAARSWAISLSSLRDLAGKLKGLPRDLATNLAYLEGIGQ